MTLQEFLNKVNGKEEDIVYYTESEALEAVKRDGYALRFVHNQPPEICLEAVKKSGNALQYVHNQTDEICLEAVKKSGNALQYVHNQTPKICLEAMKASRSSIEYVDKSIFEQSKRTIDDILAQLSEEDKEVIQQALNK